MRIAFVGKGGSGKTSISSSFIRWVAERASFVLAVDADVNTHLASALGMEAEAAQSPEKVLIPKVKEIFDFLEPDRPELQSEIGERPIIGCLPLSKNSRSIEFSPLDPTLRHFGVFKNNIGLLTAGTYAESDVGKACYHAKLFGTQLIVHRINDSKDDTIVFDVSAGTDPVATSLIIAYDLHVVIVEPTLKSVGVYLDYLKATQNVRRGPVVVVANKVRTDQDRAFIRSHIPSESLVGEIMFSPALKRFEQGDPSALGEFVECNSVIFEALASRLRTCPVDKAAYHAAIQRWFKAYSAKWYDAVYKKELGSITEAALARELAATGSLAAQ